MNNQEWTAIYLQPAQPRRGVRHQQTVLCNSGGGGVAHFLWSILFSLWMLIHLHTQSSFCTQSEGREERTRILLDLLYPTCQSRGKPNQFRLDRKSGRNSIDISLLIYHIHHYQTFKFAIQKSFFGQCWPNLFWLYSYAGSAELVIWFLCRPAGHWKVLVLILLTLRVSIVSPALNIITVSSVFSNQYEVLETNSSFEINNNAWELCPNNTLRFHLIVGDGAGILM